MLARPLTRRGALALGVTAATGVTVPAGCSGTTGTGETSGGTMDRTEPQRTAYGDDPSQWVELTLPDGEPRGVVVVIHGGFWRAPYGAELATPIAADLASRGWAALTVEYRRVGSGDGGGGGVPQTLDDVAAAIDLLADADVDLTTVVTLGHSAGGQLAAWAASRGSADQRWSGGVPVTHVISQAGALDLAQAAADGLGDGAAQEFLGGEPDQVPDAYALADPTQRIPLDQPVWCVHAPDDETVPISQSRDYVARASEAGATAELVEVTGGHFALIDPDSQAWSRIVEVLDEIG